ncbi:hypothetical protein CROQUDRAFT_8051, partial [Cronartium quercuum f. sp. fusiforme G11]
PHESTFTKPPKGLPINFYEPDWFNHVLSASQKSEIADCDNVMFLPNVEQSLLGKAHPDKKLSDKKFSKKYWDEGSKVYDMDHKIEVEEDEDEDGSD